MAQSSIEWLIEELNRNNMLSSNLKTTKKLIIQQAKEMHKQEIKNAWYDIDAKNNEIYYNKTFGGNNVTK